ncbi:hypothetical protein Avbf_11432 [Armadillidium vulgare]|nr:hypothetical protein Avbf_11432 [Armadillidium vulgare]
MLQTNWNVGISPKPSVESDDQNQSVKRTSFPQKCHSRTALKEKPRRNLKLGTTRTPTNITLGVLSK